MKNLKVQADHDLAAVKCKLCSNKVHQPCRILPIPFAANKYRTGVHALATSNKVIQINSVSVGMRKSAHFLSAENDHETSNAVSLTPENSYRYLYHHHLLALS